jgi:hypothetical protein
VAENVAERFLRAAGYTRTEGAVELLRCVFLHGGRDVRIDIGGDCDAGMTEALAHDLQGHGGDED